MKTKEELNALKKEVETVSRKPHELSDEELEQVSGGDNPVIEKQHKYGNLILEGVDIFEMEPKIVIS